MIASHESKIAIERLSDETRQTGNILGSYNVDVTPGERQGLISAAIALALLIGIAALPVKPLQMLLLGSMFILTYVTVTTTFEWAQTEHGVVSFSLIYIIMAVFVCTGLTAVVA